MVDTQNLIGEGMKLAMDKIYSTLLPGVSNVFRPEQTDFKPPIEKIVENYVDSNESARRGLTQRRSNLQQQRRQGGAQSNLDALLGQMYETSGGPNMGRIRQLEGQRSSLMKNYETNKADAQNLYGTLSSDDDTKSTGLIGAIEQMGNELAGSYDAQLEASKTASAGRQTALSSEQSRQQANRERAAKELGIAPESIMTDYGSDTALNQAMGNVADRATSWEELLRSNKLSEEGATGRLITAAQNTRADTLLGMKSFLDSQLSQLDAQIAAERAVGPTQKLTSLGKRLEDKMNERALATAQEQFPDIFGAGAEPKLTGRQQSQRDVMTELGIGPSQYNMLKEQALTKYRARSGGDRSTATALTDAEAMVLDSLGLPQYLLD